MKSIVVIGMVSTVTVISLVFLAIVSTDIAGFPVVLFSLGVLFVYVTAISAIMAQAKLENNTEEKSE